MPKSASAALEGKKAPAFELSDADGKTVALKQLIGANKLGYVELKNHVSWLP